MVTVIGYLWTYKKTTDFETAVPSLTLFKCFNSSPSGSRSFINSPQSAWEGHEKKVREMNQFLGQSQKKRCFGGYNTFNVAKKYAKV